VHSYRLHSALATLAVLPPVNAQLLRRAHV